MLEWLPENISTYGGDVDRVIGIIYRIVGAWFVIAEFIFIYFIVRYSRKGRDGRKAAYAPGTTWKSLAWVLVPAALVLVFDLSIDFAATPVWAKIKQQLPERPDRTIRIMARQFAWEFTSAGSDGKLGTNDDVVSWNQLHVPVDENIVFELGSYDVIHSFWLPHARLKQDAVPGRTIKGWFNLTKTGDYPIGCAEICGVGHGAMKGELHVHSAEDYAAWLAGQYEEASE